MNTTCEKRSIDRGNQRIRVSRDDLDGNMDLPNGKIRVMPGCRRELSEDAPYVNPVCQNGAIELPEKIGIIR